MFTYEGFPGGSVSKESACNTGTTYHAENAGLIPGLGRSLVSYFIINLAYVKHELFKELPCMKSIITF